ncbi:alpha/beta fold hydrolase [Agrococcus sp. KRD186]|uniref:alpha/beta fold hydrolase n=1 Tax=Agrococcus sp. KRD186 TaxID=2729730 RepID=UPI0019D2FF2C|nr:alpha/beta fold hydrolase [Agrococcus sp. KRD186]
MGLVDRSTRALAAAFGRVPWQARIAAGVLIGLIGLVLVVRPFLSLAALVVLLAIALILQGVAELLRVDAARPARTWGAVLAAIAWIVGGALVLVWPALSIASVTIIVGVGLIIAGLVGAIRAIRGDRDHRVAEALLGTATVVLGALALTWPDVTVFVLAIVLGVRMVLFGIELVAIGIRHARGRATDASARPERAGGRGWVRTTGAVLALVGCTALLLVSLSLGGTTRADAFYDAPDEVPAEPGQLLRSEPFGRSIPAGARAWRILYTTTDHAGEPALASGLVVQPEGDQPHPVIAWAHGTTGYATGCAPSLLPEPFVAGAFPDLDGALAEGWAVVATDYAGLGTAGPQPYLIGQGEGRSVLDAVRAAQQLDDARLASETVLWGHSQGGHAALWAAGLAPDYAPELDLLGVAAMAPATDLPAFLGTMDESVVGAMFGSFALAASADAYGDVERGAYVRPGARIMMDEMERRCLTDPSTLVSLATSIVADQPVWARSLSEGALAERAAENVPTLPIAMPVLLAQGGADPLITPALQDAYVAARCAEGQQVDYRGYPGYDHMGVVTGDSPLLPELRAWSADMLAGLAPVDTCA